ncbi:tetratricopeptide repeat protein, partial [bacterium]|nr:tetratricopeptide repeat protein [bacterium]
LDYGKLYWGLDDDSHLGQSFVGYAHRIGNLGNLKIDGTLGFGWLNFALTRYYREDTFILAFGKRIPGIRAGSLAAGMSLKVLYKGFKKTLYTENAVNLDTSELKGGRDPVFENGYSHTGFSTDLGFLYDLGRHHSFALTLNDINQPNMGLLDKDKVAFATKLGYAYRSNNFNMTSDLTFKRRDITISAGAEKWFMGKTLGVRAGLGIGAREYASLCLGASYRYSRLFQFDYGFVYPLRGISSFYGSHRFSLTLRFGVKAPEEVELEEELIKTKSELESAKEAAEKSRLVVEEMMKAKETSEIEIREAQETQGETQEALNRLEKELLGIKERLQAEKEAKERVMEVQRYWEQGFSYYREGEYQEAIVEFEKILKLDPSHAQARRLIIELEAKIQEKTQPRKIKDIEESQRHYTKALSAYTQGHLEEAIKEWEEALKLSPGNLTIESWLEAARRELELKRER